LRCLSLLFVLGSAFAATPDVLRVCADPNNLPFSNSAGEGFENHLAAIIAQDLHADLQYVWLPERKSFLTRSLGENRCDVVLGVPSGTSSVPVTHPYYRSTYVFVARQDRHITPTSLLDPNLAHFRIGVHVVDDNYAPPAILLAREGLSANITGYSLYGSEGELNPPAKLIEAVVCGDVDLAIIWGPFAGYFSKRAKSALEIVPVSPSSAGAIPFTYSISAAVRAGDDELKSKIDRVFTRECKAIQVLLDQYGIPRMPEEETAPCDSSQAHSGF
jgi:quinoprotein dehydrogenase-associated probable ABC transporter substrate-binding protein